MFCPLSRYVQNLSDNLFYYKKILNAHFIFLCRTHALKIGHILGLRYNPDPRAGAMKGYSGQPTSRLRDQQGHSYIIDHKVAASPLQTPMVSNDGKINKCYL